MFPNFASETRHFSTDLTRREAKYRFDQLCMLCKAFFFFLSLNKVFEMDNKDWTQVENPMQKNQIHIQSLKIKKKLDSDPTIS